MRATLLRLLGWIATFVLAVYGFRSAPETRGLVDERIVLMLPWFKEAWVSLLGVALAGAIATLLLSEPFWRRWLRKEIKRAEGGAFRETDAEQVLQYLSNESVWAWRQYARLNYFACIPPHHLHEFRAAARKGDIRCAAGGMMEKRDQVYRIDRRYWDHARIAEETSSGGPDGVCTEKSVPQRPNHYVLHFTRLAVASDDVEDTWPRASFLRRQITSFYVWLKIKYYSIKWPRKLITPSSS